MLFSEDSASEREGGELRPPADCARWAGVAVGIAEASGKSVFLRYRGTVAEGGGGGVSVAVVFPGKARWGGEGGSGEGEPLSREQRGSPSPGDA